MIQRDIEAVNESIKHWNRMIAWVRTQPEGNPARDNVMYDAIGEAWYGKNCPLCNQHEECSTCPLALADRPCSYEGSVWSNVDYSSTWGDWIDAALHMVEALTVIAREESAR